MVRLSVKSHAGKDFDSLIKIFIFLMLLHCLLMSLDIVIPIALLYGPAHLSLHRMSGQKTSDRYLYIQLLPFFLLSIFYCVLFYSMKTEAIWSESMVIYYPIHYVCAMVSSFGYGAYIWFAKRDGSYKQNQLQLVLQLATIAFIIGLFILLLFLSNINIGKIDKESLGFDPIFIVVGLLVFSICIMISYLITASKESKRDNGTDNLEPIKVENAKYNAFNIEDDVLKEYAMLLEKAIIDKKLHLLSGLSLDDLLIETGIPKHHLSQVFNAYFGKTFYQYIAELRIQEAISRIEDDDNITLESLAYECGFNSKTSFNRYFKELVGMTPSEYRASRETVL